MMQIVAIGLAAGAASALLFASVASGSLLSIFLFYASALPLMIAGLGWSHLAALVGAVSAATVLGGVLGPFFFAAFLGSIGLPAWWLAYLTLLGRPVTDANGQTTMEWYPVGRLVLWAAGIAAALVAIALSQLGSDLDSVQSVIKASMERILRAQAGIGGDQPLVLPGLDNPQALIDVLAASLPPTAALLAMATMLLNLYGAARVADLSGRLKRPIAGIADMAFPRVMSLALIAALVATSFGGLVGVAGVVASATLIAAFAILGFATLHVVTRGMGMRGFILSTLYVGAFVFGWPVALVALVGLADLIFDLRGRARAGQSPNQT
jgi:hypothetical protein